MTKRAQVARPIVCVDETLAHTYIRMKPEPKDLSKVHVLIKRADGTELGEDDAPCCAPWLLNYPAHDYDAGYIGFRWDGDIHKLGPGRYIAEIQIDCTPCHRFTLWVPDCPQVGGRAKNLTVEEVMGE